MDREELIKKLEQTKIPEVKLTNHKSRMKIALLADPCFEKNQEVDMNSLKSRTAHIIDAIGNKLVSQQPLWKVALSTAAVVVVFAAVLFTIPSVGPKLASLVPGGSVEISGRHLTSEQKDKALAILRSDPRIEELLQQGAIIPPEYILSLQVGMSKVDSETGKIREVTETWAEAQIKLGDQEYKAQVDLVEGKVVSISGFPANGPMLASKSPIFFIEDAARNSPEIKTALGGGEVKVVKAFVLEFTTSSQRGIVLCNSETTGNYVAAEVDALNNQVTNIMALPNIDEAKAEAIAKSDADVKKMLDNGGEITGVFPVYSANVQTNMSTLQTELVSESLANIMIKFGTEHWVAQVHTGEQRVVKVWQVAEVPVIGIEEAPETGGDHE
jgi:hypothetical protein